MEAIARWLVRHPLLVIAGDLAITAVLGVFAWRIGIESGVETLIPPNDPAIARDEDVRRTFGSDDVAVVGVVADDVLAPETIAKIHRLTAALERLPGVAEVVSLANAVDPAADVLSPPPLLANLPPSRADVEALRFRLGEVPLYARNLVSPDLRGAAIHVFFDELVYADYQAQDLDGRIETILDAERGPCSSAAPRPTSCAARGRASASRSRSSSSSSPRCSSPGGSASSRCCRTCCRSPSSSV